MIDPGTERMGWLPARGDFRVRAGLVVGVSTFVLTAAFMGVLGLVSGEVAEIGQRLPYYLIVAGGAFVGTVILLEEHGAAAEVIIVSAVVTGALALLAVSLSVEGLVFAYHHPERVLLSQLVLYFIAAALIGTGIAYWGVNHWRELTGPDSGGR